MCGSLVEYSTHLQKILTDRQTDGPTDRPTDRQTDRPTKLGTEAPSPELKKKVNQYLAVYLYQKVRSENDQKKEQ